MEHGRRGVVIIRDGVEDRGLAEGFVAESRTFNVSELNPAGLATDHL